MQLLVYLNRRAASGDRDWERLYDAYTDKSGNVTGLTGSGKWTTFPAHVVDRIEQER